MTTEATRAALRLSRTELLLLLYALEELYSSGQCDRYPTATPVLARLTSRVRKHVGSINYDETRRVRQEARANDRS